MPADILPAIPAIVAPAAPLATPPHDYRVFFDNPLHDEALRLLLLTPMSARPVSYARLTGDDGDGCPVQCGDPACCAIIPLATSESAISAHRYTAGLAPVLCGHPTADSGQHFACSIDHLTNALDACWRDHIRPGLRAQGHPTA